MSSYLQNVEIYDNFKIYTKIIVFIKIDVKIFKCNIH